MGKFQFRYLQPEEYKEVLPRMFCILYTNMSAIVPSDTEYEEDRKLWLTYIVPALEQGNVRILLMLAGMELAGYFQYSLREDALLAEEVEIQPEYQRTMLFYRCCQYLLADVPEGVRYLESYVNKDNQNSLAIHRKLGMEIIGENKSGRSWHFQGDIRAIGQRFPR